MDEVFGFVGSQVDFGPAITGSDNAGARLAVLDADDTVYASIRDVNFARVGPLLKQEVVRIGASYDDIRGAATGEPVGV